jgi:hypothetical protein
MPCAMRIVERRFRARTVRVLRALADENANLVSPHGLVMAARFTAGRQ